MEKEVEIRFKISNPDEKEKLLREMGWQPVVKKQKDEYFCKEKFIQKTSKAMPFLLRIRASNGNFQLALKSLCEGSWIEKETEISDPKSTRELLAFIGMTPFMKIFKTRQQGRVDEFEVNLDEVKDLGTFIEIELPSVNVPEAKAKIMTLAQKLGLGEADRIDVGYVPLMEAAGKGLFMGKTG